MSRHFLSEAIMSKLHLYAQLQWHDEAYIVGNRQALESLRDAISKVLASEGPELVDTFASDGEGYCVAVALSDDETFDKLAPPYTSDIAKPTDKNNFIWPWNIQKIVAVLKHKFGD